MMWNRFLDWAAFSKTVEILEWVSVSGLAALWIVGGSKLMGWL